MPSVDALLQYIANLMGSIGSFIQSTVTSLRDWAASVFTSIRDFITALGNEIRGFFTTMVNAITTAFTNLTNFLRNAYQEMVNWIYSTIGPFITQLTTWFNNAFNQLVLMVKGAIDSLYSWVQAAVAAITNAVMALINPVISWFNDIASQAKTLIVSVITSLEESWEQFVALIKASYEDLLGGANSLIESIGERLVNVREGFEAAAQKVTDEIAAKAGEIFGPWTALFEDLIKPFKEIATPEELDSVRAALSEALSPNTLDLKSRNDAHRLFERIMPGSPVAKTVFLLALSIPMILRVYGGVVDANAQVVLQEFATNYHFNLLPPPDLAAAVHRGVMPRDDAEFDIVKQGFSPKNAEILIDNSFNVPAVGELTAMKLREIITEKDYSEALAKQAFAPEWVKRFKELAEVIPPVGDLVTMSVHGAFSEEETKLFRTDEDFPESIVEYCAKQGLSDEWMRKYWRAHWSLPSPSQGFEMFQRAIISEVELLTLLKALDITPFWRDKMVSLSYSTLGRVDIRRLHQLGLMSREELVKAHKDLGYSPDDAERLSTFVEELNQGKPGEADEELGRLSRTNVINFYQDGVIDRPRAIDLLVKIGYKQDAAMLFLETADFDAERVTRSANIDFIMANAQAGVISFEEAQDRLGELHLSPTELDRATAKLLREQTRATKLPTVEQGTKMYQAKAISETTFKDLLRRLGYRSEWAQAFVTLATKPESKPA